MNTHGSGVLLVCEDRRVVLQLRDNIDSIVEPAKLSIFGGASEKEETSLETALREVNEETNLEIKRDDLKLFGTYGINSQKIAVYVIECVKTDKLKVYEGQGYKIVDPKNIPNSVATQITEVTKKIIHDYFN